MANHPSLPVKANITPQKAAFLRRLATWASLIVASTLIGAKFTAWLATGSVAMLSALVDSTVDLMASIVTFIGVARALRPPDMQHRFGYGKAEPLAALAQAAFVCGSAILLCYEAVSRILKPEPVVHAAMALWVMVFAVLASLALVALQRYVIARTGSVAISADSLHYRGDIYLNLSVIAALLLAKYTGNLFFDPLFALLVAAILLYGAYGIARDALGLLLDRELPASTRDEISQQVLSHPLVRGLHDLRTRSDGERWFIELHLELDGHITLNEAHSIADAIEQRLMQLYPTAEILVHQEPAGLDDTKRDHRLR